MKPVTKIAAVAAAGTLLLTGTLKYRDYREKADAAQFIENRISELSATLPKRQQGVEALFLWEGEKSMLKSSEWERDIWIKRYGEIPAKEIKLVEEIEDLRKSIERKSEVVHRTLGDWPEDLIARKMPLIDQLDRDMKELDRLKHEQKTKTKGKP